MDRLLHIHALLRKIPFLLSCIVAAACGGRKPASPAAPVSREFPLIEVPSLYTETEERVGYAVAHFWDRFLDTSRVYTCDSVLVNGVTADALEEQFGTFVSLAEMVPLKDGKAAVEQMFNRAEAFGRKEPAVFKSLSDLARKYLYDPNSPVRSEDLYQPWVRRLSASPLVDSLLYLGYAWEAKMCALNGIGTKATDFSFTDTRGRRRTLYGIQADHLLLIFGNPDCKACRELTEEMGAEPSVSALIKSGSLKVVDVYIDREINEWKAHMAEYPADWINGYDHSFSIRSDLLYNIRGIPSIYLLDASKTVLLKDAPADKVLEALAAL